MKVEIANAKKIISDGKKKEKALYGNIFNKISVYDDKAVPFIPGNSGKNPQVSTILLIITIILMTIIIIIIITIIIVIIIKNVIEN